jgi:hypothetical protein
MPQYPKVIDAKFWVQKIDPLEWYKTVDPIAHSNDFAYAVKKCKAFAEAEKGKNRVLFYRVLEYRGEVVFLSQVNFDDVNHWDFRQKRKEAKPRDEDKKD